MRTPGCVIDHNITSIAGRLLERGQYLAVAESCTGGLLAAACTERPGSSGWFDRGFVTYSDAAKSELLGVDPGLIAAHGAVSEPVVEAMLAGTLEYSIADWAVAVSGVAGPGGATADKPVGTVHIGWARRDGVCLVRGFALSGDRSAVRTASVAEALAGLAAQLG